MGCYHRKWNLTRWRRRAKVKRSDKPNNKEPPKVQMCKVCGLNPIAKGNRIMCNECFREASNVHSLTMELNLYKTGGWKNDK